MHQQEELKLEIFRLSEEYELTDLINGSTRTEISEPTTLPNLTGCLLKML